MVLVQIWSFFQPFFLGNIKLENILYDIIERKFAFLGYKNNKFKKWKNCLFFKGVNPWFWCKDGHFSNLFFKAILVRKTTFTTFQNEKTPFQAIKIRSSNRRKIEVFPKVLTHGFGPKVAIFRIFFLGNIGLKIIFYNIIERKNAFLGYKNKQFKKSKN